MQRTVTFTVEIDDDEAEELLDDTDRTGLTAEAYVDFGEWLDDNPLGAVDPSTVSIG